MIKIKLFSLLSVALISQITFAEINSATITEATISAVPNCLHYRVLGICYWMNDVGINTTPFVEHYLPDVVVTVFNQPSDDPWTEIKTTVDQAGSAAEKQIVSYFSGFQAGDGQHSFTDPHEQNVFFKEADVMGNPGLAALSIPGLLPSTATPLVPYYQSMLDAALWRGFPIGGVMPPEEIYAVVADIPHHIGNVVINWGGIYPHEGKIATSNDAKAAAVIAQRAGDLVTSSDVLHLTGHIYHQLSNQCGQECNASPVKENSKETQFQMIYPIQNNQCDYFGKTATYGNNIETKTKGAYAWIIWRHYKGCRDGDGKYIGKTIFSEGKQQ